MNDPNPQTTAQWRAALTRQLTQAEIEHPAREAVILLRQWGFDPTLEPDAPISPNIAEQLSHAAARRAAGEPMAYILGRKGFWTLDLSVGPGVLTPRPETEHVVETALGCDVPSHPRILDLGVGSGAILLSLLSELPGAWGVGVDISTDALRIAQMNAAAIGLAKRCALVCADWDAPLLGQFDLIVSNPPYVRTGDIVTLERDVREYEPHVALDGGADGLDFYRRLAESARNLLATGGSMVMEFGADQSTDVEAMFMRLSFDGLQLVKDFSGKTRVAVLRQVR